MKKILKNAVSEVLEKLNYPHSDIAIQLPKNPEHGDFTTNIAMQLVKTLKKNPKDIANEIIDELLKSYSNIIYSINIAGPGFINIKMNRINIITQLIDIIKSDNQFGQNIKGKNKKAQIEFISANPTGPLTVGHGRGAILGDVIANILIWSGYDVEREYYYNNAGKQMTRLGESVKSRYLELNEVKTDFPDQGYEGEYIINIAKDIKKLHGSSLINSDNINFFKEFAEKEIFKNINATLNKLGLQFDNFFNENSLYDSGAIDYVIKKLNKKNLTYKKDGAIWFKASKTGREQDRVIIKSTGEPTYRLPDIAYHLNKFNRNYDLMIDILGADHMDAYPDVLAAIKELGCKLEKIKIIIHQFVTLIENDEPVKMSTRKAQYITLDELIENIGIDVVRYFFIMRGKNSHLNFDLNLARDESDENPVYYLQYAHARLCNIIKHADSQGYALDLNTDLSLLILNSEYNLVKALLEFPDVIQKALHSLEPQTISNYLQNIASMFHKYYAKERVISNDVDLSQARLILIKSIRIVLFNGLKILGIKAPERM